MEENDIGEISEIPASPPAATATDPESTFWNQIAERLRRFIRSRVEDTHITEDLVQDVILKAQMHLDSAPMDKLSAWLFQIARNVVIDHYRSREVRRTSMLDDETAAAETEAAVVAELSGCIRPMLTRLPQPYREALAQTDLGEMTQAELAAQLSLSLAGVKSRVQRAREQFRSVLMSCCAPKTAEDGTIVDHDCQCQPPDYCSEKSGKC